MNIRQTLQLKDDESLEITIQNTDKNVVPVKDQISGEILDCLKHQQLFKKSYVKRILDSNPHKVTLSERFSVVSDRNTLVKNKACDKSQCAHKNSKSCGTTVEFPKKAKNNNVGTTPNEMVTSEVLCIKQDLTQKQSKHSEVNKLFKKLLSSFISNQHVNQKVLSNDLLLHSDQSFKRSSPIHTLYGDTKKEVGNFSRQLVANDHTYSVVCSSDDISDTNQPPSYFKEILVKEGTQNYSSDVEGIESINEQECNVSEENFFSSDLNVIETVEITSDETAKTGDCCSIEVPCYPNGKVAVSDELQEVIEQRDNFGTTRIVPAWDHEDLNFDRDDTSANRNFDDIVKVMASQWTAEEKEMEIQITDSESETSTENESLADLCLSSITDLEKYRAELLEQLANVSNVVVDYSSSSDSEVSKVELSRTAKDEITLGGLKSLVSYSSSTPEMSPKESCDIDINLSDFEVVDEWKDLGCDADIKKAKGMLRTCSNVANDKKTTNQRDNESENDGLADPSKSLSKMNNIIECSLSNISPDEPELNMMLICAGHPDCDTHQSPKQQNSITEPILGSMCQSTNEKINELHKDACLNVENVPCTTNKAVSNGIAYDICYLKGQSHSKKAIGNNGNCDNKWFGGSDDDDVHCVDEIKGMRLSGVSCSDDGSSSVVSTIESEGKMSTIFSPLCGIEEESFSNNGSVVNSEYEDDFVTIEVEDDDNNDVCYLEQDHCAMEEEYNDIKIDENGDLMCDELQYENNMISYIPEINITDFRQVIAVNKSLNKCYESSSDSEDDSKSYDRFGAEQFQYYRMKDLDNSKSFSDEELEEDYLQPVVDVDYVNSDPLPELELSLKDLLTLRTINTVVTKTWMLLEEKKREDKEFTQINKPVNINVKQGKNVVESEVDTLNIQNNEETSDNHEQTVKETSQERIENITNYNENVSVVENVIETIFNDIEQIKELEIKGNNDSLIKSDTQVDVEELKNTDKPDSETQFLSEDNNNQIVPVKQSDEEKNSNLSCDDIQINKKHAKKQRKRVKAQNKAKESLLQKIKEDEESLRVKVKHVKPSAKAQSNNNERKGASRLSDQDVIIIDYSSSDENEELKNKSGNWFTLNSKWMDKKPNCDVQRSGQEDSEIRKFYSNTDRKVKPKLKSVANKAPKLGTKNKPHETVPYKTCANGTRYSDTRSKFSIEPKCNHLRYNGTVDRRCRTDHTEKRYSSADEEYDKYSHQYDVIRSRHLHKEKYDSNNNKTNSIGTKDLGCSASGSKRNERRDQSYKSSTNSSNILSIKCLKAVVLKTGINVNDYCVHTNPFYNAEDTDSVKILLEQVEPILQEIRNQGKYSDIGICQLKEKKYELLAWTEFYMSRIVFLETGQIVFNHHSRPELPCFKINDEREEYQILWKVPTIAQMTDLLDWQDKIQELQSSKSSKSEKSFAIYTQELRDELVRQLCTPDSEDPLSDLTDKLYYYKLHQEKLQDVDTRDLSSIQYELLTYFEIMCCALEKQLAAIKNRSKYRRENSRELVPPCLDSHIIHEDPAFNNKVDDIETYKLQNGDLIKVPPQNGEQNKALLEPPNFNSRSTLDRASCVKDPNLNETDLCVIDSNSNVISTAERDICMNGSNPNVRFTTEREACMNDLYPNVRFTTERDRFVNDTNSTLQFTTERARCVNDSNSDVRFTAERDRIENDSNPNVRFTTERDRFVNDSNQRDRCVPNANIGFAAEVERHVNVQQHEADSNVEDCQFVNSVGFCRNESVHYETEIKEYDHGNTMKSVAGAQLDNANSKQVLSDNSLQGIDSSTLKHLASLDSDTLVTLLKKCAPSELQNISNNITQNIDLNYQDTNKVDFGSQSQSYQEYEKPTHENQINIPTSTTEHSHNIGLVESDPALGKVITNEENCANSTFLENVPVASESSAAQGTTVINNNFFLSPPHYSPLIQMEQSPPAYGYSSTYGYASPYGYSSPYGHTSPYSLSPTFGHSPVIHSSPPSYGSIHPWHAASAYSQQPNYCAPQFGISPLLPNPIGYRPPPLLPTPPNFGTMVHGYGGSLIRQHTGYYPVTRPRLKEISHQPYGLRELPEPNSSCVTITKAADSESVNVIQNDRTTESGGNNTPVDSEIVLSQNEQDISDSRSIVHVDNRPVSLDSRTVVATRISRWDLRGRSPIFPPASAAPSFVHFNCSPTGLIPITRPRLYSVPTSQAFQ